jgi:DNA-binding IclR family transcriptional regulator
MRTFVPLSQSKPTTPFARFPPGTLSPMHASGIGKAFVGAVAAKRVDAMLARAP